MSYVGSSQREIAVELFPNVKLVCPKNTPHRSLIVDLLQLLVKETFATLSRSFSMDLHERVERFTFERIFSQKQFVITERPHAICSDEKWIVFNLGHGQSYHLNGTIIYFLETNDYDMLKVKARRHRDCLLHEIMHMYGCLHAREGIMAGKNSLGRNKIEIDDKAKQILTFSHPFVFTYGSLSHSPVFHQWDGTKLEIGCKDVMKFVIVGREGEYEEINTDPVNPLRRVQIEMKNCDSCTVVTHKHFIHYISKRFSTPNFEALREELKEYINGQREKTSFLPNSTTKDDSSSKSPACSSNSASDKTISTCSSSTKAQAETTSDNTPNSTSEATITSTETNGTTEALHSEVTSSSNNNVTESASVPFARRILSSRPEVNSTSERSPLQVVSSSNTKFDPQAKKPSNGAGPLTSTSAPDSGRRKFNPLTRSCAIDPDIDSKVLPFLSALYGSDRDDSKDTSSRVRNRSDNDAVGQMGPPLKRKFYPIPGFVDKTVRYETDQLFFPEEMTEPLFILDFDPIVNNQGKKGLDYLEGLAEVGKLNCTRN